MPTYVTMLTDPTATNPKPIGAWVADDPHDGAFRAEAHLAELLLTDGSCTSLDEAREQAHYLIEAGEYSIVTVEALA